MISVISASLGIDFQYLCCFHPTITYKFGVGPKLVAVLFQWREVCLSVLEGMSAAVSYRDLRGTVLVLLEVLFFRLLGVSEVDIPIKH